MIWGTKGIEVPSVLFQVGESRPGGMEGRRQKFGELLLCSRGARRAGIGVTAHKPSVPLQQVGIQERDVNPGMAPASF